MAHSSVYRCDRCGAQSKPTPGSALPEGWAELDLAQSEQTGAPDPFDADTAELCPACIVALRRWLEDVS